MLSLSFVDGYRIGTFTWNKKTAPIPNLLTVKEDIVYLNDITIERPTLYEKEAQIDMRTASVLRIPYTAPKNIALQFTRRNSNLLSPDFEAYPLYITKYDTLTTNFLSKIPFHHLFFIFCPEERRLLRTLFYIRNAYPRSLLYTRAEPEEIPVLFTAGIDLFNYTEENKEALHRFLENPTKEYLEKECNSTVRTKRLLRLLYREFYEHIEKYTSFKRKKELYISEDALYRPEVRRFRQRIRERYTPPSNVVVLFPCSAKKPYSQSQSHRKFRTAIPRNALLTELILTSPLGVVPRELEDFARYDIPVTGHWSHEEVVETASLLNDVIARIQNPVVYSHVSPAYQPIIDNLHCPVIDTAKDNPLSEQSLATLASHLKDVDKKPFLERKMRAVSDFLFSEDIFPDRISIKGRRTKLIRSDKVLAKYSSDLILARAGADRVTTYCVNIDFDLKGDVFCPGVLSAYSGIRPGDHVVIKRIINGERAVGVGRAVLPGFMMKEMDRGMAVKVHTRFHYAGTNNC
jgi:predicted RNA-binding protein (TIGR00451 family)